MAKKGIRVFLDSNVILSGLLSDKGSPRIILDLLSIQLPGLCGITGKYNLIEIERNIKNKLPALLPLYRKYLPVLSLEIISLPSLNEINALSGSISEKDIPVLASAVIGKADYLVTGDKKDFGKLRAKDKYPFRILSPSKFLKVILLEVLKEIKEK